MYWVCSLVAVDGVSATISDLYIEAHLRKRGSKMNKKYKLSVALDVDDLLMECTSYAIRLANEKYQFNPPMTIYEKERWWLVRRTC